MGYTCNVYRMNNICCVCFQPGPMEKMTHIELSDIQCQDVKARSFDVSSIVFQVCKNCIYDRDSVWPEIYYILTKHDNLVGSMSFMKI